MHRSTVLALLLLTLSAPLSAYTIYLRDGSRILVRDEPRIEADRAIVTLQNGTESFLSLDEIDLEKTREANANSYDGAVALGSDMVTIDTPAESTEPETLGDLIDSGTAGTRMRPTAKRPTASPTTDKPAAAATRATPRPRREEHADLVLVGEIQEAFQAQGLEGVEVFKTASAGRPLVEVRTNSEAAVFRALETAAPLLLHLQDSFPGQTEELELVFYTDRDDSAGRFILDPNSASALTEKEVNVSAFYVQRVLF